jgi:hypothetical protein
MKGKKYLIKILCVPIKLICTSELLVLKTAFHLFHIAMVNRIASKVMVWNPSSNWLCKLVPDVSFETFIVVMSQVKVF